MKPLITGCSGFVGLALAEHLLAAGEDVLGFDLSPVPPVALAMFSAQPGRFVGLQGDVRDAAQLRQAMQMHRPQRVVSLAAITADAQRERLAPQAIFEVNVGGVLAAISAATLPASHPWATCNGWLAEARSAAFSPEPSVAAIASACMVCVSLRRSNLATAAADASGARTAVLWNPRSTMAG